MYTQCPECSVAFRVTADILRQAAGKVRCGGCGVAFNALDYLSENKPQPRAKPETERRLPELKPEPRDDAGNKSRMQSISAEQSAALLKTLDQLAGEDIRIEDTGVEWRVLDVNEPAEDSGETANDDMAASRTGSLKFVLQNTDDGSPAVIDQGGQCESEASDAGAVEAEMRFDDNTPLPDDFGLDGDSAFHATAADPVVDVAAEAADSGDLQVDVALGDPDEWQDLLGEVADDRANASELVDGNAAFTSGDDAAMETGERAADDPPDVDTQFALQAEALSGIYATIEADPAATGEVDAAAAETSIDDDLIAAAFESEAAARAEATAAARLREDTADDGHGDALEDAIDLEATAAADLEDEPTERVPLEYDKPEERDELTEAAKTAEEESEAEPDAFTAQPGRFEALAAAPDELETASWQLDASAAEPQEFAAESGQPAAAVPDAADFEDTPTDAAEHDAGEPAYIETEVLQPASAGAEHEVPEMTEEEMTINMMIDQDLLAIAVEDADGFASTIVQKQPGSKDGGAAKKARTKRSQRPAEDVPLVETIIMEGETFRGALDAEQQVKKAGFVAQARKAVRSQFQDDEDERRPVNSRMIAGIVLLLLLLAAQAVHQLRESLATVPAFNQSIGPIYRTIGKPVTPAWDVSGWRFEATKGSTDDSDEFLTIYSRIGNTSQEALPYPLLHVSLTDRFEETVGSRVLEPAEYLADESDPRNMVTPGSTFDAVISIESPATAATGFKLNVCYRMAGGQLRCAIEDFR
ncbi:MAG: zinc-ribbon domain-containing protein [Gammaproteobacteria bacterium]|nr:zinc-ribbon domain-containing protein [Gammaproteobacteria bacterium]